MRPEKEIRALRDALKKLDAQPCDCHKGAHALQCQVGGAMMKSVIANLTWALGDSDELSHHIEEVLSRAAQV